MPVPIGEVRRQVIALRAADPYMRAIDISRQLGTSRERIRQCLIKEGLPTRVKKPLQAHPCRTCGAPVYRPTVFCSPECGPHAKLSTLECCECGASFTRPWAQVRPGIQKREQTRFFCSKECQGKRLAREHGFQAHPENITLRGSRVVKGGRVQKAAICQSTGSTSS